MRGKVLGFDKATGEGMISGDDGKRYPVNRSSLKGGATMLSAGKEVDFEVIANRAENVYVFPGTINLSETNRYVAALLAFFFGAFGVHKFYLGKKRAGIIMLLCFFPGMFLVVPMIAVVVISLAETVIYLLKDEQTFYDDYIVGDRQWL